MLIFCLSAETADDVLKLLDDMYNHIFNLRAVVVSDASKTRVNRVLDLEAPEVGVVNISDLDLSTWAEIHEIDMEDAERLQFQSRRRKDPPTPIEWEAEWEEQCLSDQLR